MHADDLVEIDGDLDATMRHDMGAHELAPLTTSGEPALGATVDGCPPGPLGRRFGVDQPQSRFGGRRSPVGVPGRESPDEAGKPLGERGNRLDRRALELASRLPPAVLAASLGLLLLEGLLEPLQFLCGGCLHVFPGRAFPGSRGVLLRPLQQALQRLALLEPFAKFVSLRPQRIVAERLEFGFERVDTLDILAHALDQPFVTAAENFG